MFCAKCGAQIIDIDKYCAKCGNSVATLDLNKNNDQKNTNDLEKLKKLIDWEPSRKGFPSALFLLPILLGMIGGIVGAMLAARVYKSRWWQMIAMGIVFSVIWYVVYIILISL